MLTTDDIQKIYQALSPKFDDIDKKFRKLTKGQKEILNFLEREQLMDYGQ